jgi:dynein heavy chain, axonemal
MMVGDSMSGKSIITECLKEAMCRLAGSGEFNKVEINKLNPKSIMSYQLYGLFDNDTKQWTDGVLPKIMRELATQGDIPDRKWIVFDGPVDAVWIENMNTVLDDNKKLCLTSGEIIKLTRWMTMMFEVEDL